MDSISGKTIVLIPAYKPDKILINFARSLYEVGYSILIVDDGSGINYNDIFKSVEEYATVLRYRDNRGKGVALKTGMKYLVNNNVDFNGLITADADGQHALADIFSINTRIEDNDIVLGCRNFSKGIPIKSELGNKVTRIVFRLASGVNVNDTQTGLRGFSAKIVPDLIDISGERYEYETNVLLWAARESVHMEEIDIETIYEDNNRGSHFNPIRDSIRIYSCFLKFIVSSFSSFVIDFLLLILFNWLLTGKNTGENLVISIILARGVSSFYNFIINKRIVFCSRNKLIESIFKYYVLVIFILGANCILMYLLDIVFGMTLVLAKIITEFMLFFVSYYVQKKVIFKRRKKIINEKRI